MSPGVLSYTPQQGPPQVGQLGLELELGLGLGLGLGLVCRGGGLRAGRADTLHPEVAVLPAVPDLGIGGHWGALGSWGSWGSLGVLGVTRAQRAHVAPAHASPPCSCRSCLGLSPRKRSWLLL